MKTVADPNVLQSLKRRLGLLRADTPRRWGTLTPHEMLCHLGDATAMVLRTRPRTVPILHRRRPIAKALAAGEARGVLTPVHPRDGLIARAYTPLHGVGPR